MKEIFSAFGSEIFRPLATIVIPGAMAISVWFVTLLRKFPSFCELASANHTETAILLAVASIAAGLVVEDIGSRIESKLFDNWVKKDPGCSEHQNEWNQYLRLAFKIEPVGQRYLRSIVLRMKFELGTSIALLWCGVGLYFSGLALCGAFICSTLCVVFAYYLGFVEARSSHRLASKVRREILKGTILYPTTNGTLEPEYVFPEKS